MSSADVKILLDRALREPFGVRLRCSDLEQAESLRQYLYRTREKLRRVGHREYDILKFRLAGTEVWLVSKTVLSWRRSRPLTLPGADPLTMADLERLPRPPFFDPRNRRG